MNTVILEEEDLWGRHTIPLDTPVNTEFKIMHNNEEVLVKSVLKGNRNTKYMPIFNEVAKYGIIYYKSNKLELPKSFKAMDLILESAMTWCLKDRFDKALVITKKGSHIVHKIWFSSQEELNKKIEESLNDFTVDLDISKMNSNNIIFAILNETGHISKDNQYKYANELVKEL